MSKPQFKNRFSKFSFVIFSKTNSQILIKQILIFSKPKFSNDMTIKAIQDKLYQYGYNWQYTWTGEIQVSKPNSRYQIFKSWNKVKETIFWWLK